MGTLRSEEFVYCVFCLRVSFFSSFLLMSVMGGGNIPWIARSSGRLSRTRLRVRRPQSLLLTRDALVKSQPLLRGAASVSMSIAPSNWRYGVGDCASGVETAPKLDMEMGEASSARLRLEPMVVFVLVRGGFTVLGGLCVGAGRV